MSKKISITAGENTIIKVDVPLFVAKYCGSVPAEPGYCALRSEVNREWALRRRADALQELIGRSIKKSPSLTWKERLISFPIGYSEVINRIDWADEKIHWTRDDGGMDETLFNDFRERITRAKKKSD
jgi:hypothetical protein